MRTGGTGPRPASGPETPPAGRRRPRTLSREPP